MIIRLSRPTTTIAMKVTARILARRSRTKVSRIVSRWTSSKTSKPASSAGSRLTCSTNQSRKAAISHAPMTNGRAGSRVSIGMAASRGELREAVTG